MDQKTWEIAIDVYDTYGDLNFKEFTSKIEELSLSKEIRELLIDLKSSEDEASDYFDELQENVKKFVEPPMPKKLGSWTIKSLIDTGGMSSVYLAERDDDQFSMKGAVKFIHFSGYNPKVFMRFKREMQFLAMLDHPNITRIIDSGVTEYGTPWYIMEYVDGLPITTYCNEHKLSLDERLKLFIQVCDAVQHAHKNLVIHRDLKPNNIFVDHGGHVKLLDFGIAKAFSNDDSEKDQQLLTRENTALMTPEYASPEQLEGSTVSTASDVYSLAVVLHELLTGQRPYRFDEINRVKMVNEIRNNPLPKPSSVFKNQTHKPKGIKAQRLSRELDDILMAALRVEPDRRYASAEQLGRDLKNYLNNDPVMARADSRRYRFQKFVQRNKVGAVMGALAILILLFGIGGILWQSEQTRLEAERATAVTNFIVDLFETSDPAISGRSDITVKEVLDMSAGRIDQELAGQPAIQADIMSVMGQVYRSIAQFDESRNMLESALDKNIEIYGDEHPRVAASIYELGQLYFYMFDYSTADSLLSKSLDMRMKLLGEQHPDISISKRKTALARTNLGRFDEAEQLHNEALENQIRLFGRDSRTVSEGKHRLGYTLHRAGNYEEAEKYYQRSLEINQKIFGGEHPNDAGILNDLGMLFYHKADYTRAEENHRRALEIRRSLYGDNHPDISMSLNNLGLVLNRLNKNDEAEHLYREAIEMRRKLFGDEDIGIAYSLNNLVHILTDREEYEEAKKLNLESLAIRRANFGDTHPSVALMLNNIGRTIRVSGQPDEALPYIEEAYEMYKITVGESHPNAIIAAFNLALTHRDLNHYDQSLNYFEITEEGRLNIYGEEHHFFADVLFEKAILHQMMDDIELAKNEFKRAAEIYEATAPNGISTFAEARIHLSRIYSQQNQYDRAEKLLLTTYEWFDDQFEENAEMLEIVEELISFYDARGDEQRRDQFAEVLEDL
jgi:eukaryotic-like serine/threonine-protein kinase